MTGTAAGRAGTRRATRRPGAAGGRGPDGVSGTGGTGGRHGARTGTVAVVLLVLLVATATWAVTVGPAGITPAQVWTSAWHELCSLAARGAAVCGPDPLTTIERAIVWDGRAPRVVGAAVVGAGLAVCGAVMQALTRNPLADPYLLGVSSGASVGAVAVLVLGVSVLLPVAAFVGALGALVLTLALATGRGGGLSPVRTVLAGVAVAQACSAAVSIVIFTSATGDSYREVLSWLLGSLGGTTWNETLLALGALAVVGTFLVAQGRALDAFTFGDVSAAALGVDVRRTRWLLLVAVALLAGVLVSISGSIGFVGLVLPHAVRLLVGARHHRLLPLAAIAGAVFLLLADTAARSVLAPQELPVGVLTAAIGAPVFAVLLRRGAR
ncbi:putative F420-0 ABC transporter permease subunit [Georgenia faecalis]|uniref:F420-0 ABC transporter permease subunit n=1 Tax=Georgenia faecalis TaxID=2483799 RepID=A0ABV9DBJ0_9MICO